MKASDPTRGRLAVFSLESGRALRNRICHGLGIPPGRHEERAFEDGEHEVRALESVRGRDAYVVQSLHGDTELSVNDRLARTLFFLAALRDAGVDRLTLVAPYLCYSRKDRREKPRDPVSTRYVALLLEAVGIDRVVTVDVHDRAAYDNAFRVPAEHVTAMTTFADALAPVVGGQAVVVVSPDAGGVDRADRFRQALEARLDRSVAFAFVEKLRTEGVVRGGAVVGEIGDRVAIIVDDLVGTGTTLARAALSCREQGARVVHAAATHAVFTRDAVRVLGSARIERVIVLDTVATHTADVDPLRTRVRTLDCAPLLTEVIRRLHADGSVAELG
jgi:ribose-phosphate pyrophosphokinase